MGPYLKYVFLFFMGLVCFTITFAQTEKSKNLNYIKTLVEQDSISKAETELDFQINQFKSQKNYDTLVYYIYDLGKVSILQNKAIDNAIQLSEDITNATKNKQSLSTLNLELAKLYFEQNNISKAYAYGQKAKTYAQHLSNKNTLVETEYYLGDYSMKMGDIPNLESHMRNANNLIEQNKGKPYDITARVFNLMGAVMFFSSKQDSSVYYFEHALKNIESLPNNAENKYYLPASIKSNLFIIKLNQGKHTDASKLIEESLVLNQKFLNQTKNHPLLLRVKRNIAISYINLSSLYFDLGDFDRADQIAHLSYRFVKENYPPKTDEYFLATLGVSEVKTAKLEFNEALKYLNDAESCLDNMPDANNHLRAFLYNDYGQTFYKMEDFEKALFYFEKSDSFHEKSNPGEYDSNRLYQTLNLGIVLGEIGQKEKAINYIQNAYKHIINENGENNYLTNALFLTLATITFDNQDYEQTIKWCKRSFDIYNKNAEKKGYDKLYFEEKKAKIILLNAKAKYYLNHDKSILFLENLLSEIEEAIANIESRKSVISSLESVNTLLENNKEVFDFAKILNLKLYDLTKNTKYIDKLVSLHESALYNRIRTRLNINNGITFAEMPKEIIAKESAIRSKLNIKIEEEDDQEAAIETVLNSNKEWAQFLETIKKEYPKYYKMRYGTIGESLEYLKDKISSNTTVIRYLFIDEELYAFVLKKESQKLIKLDYGAVKNHIKELQKNQHQLAKTNDLLFELYQALWKPFAAEITAKNIVIIPDGELYNLSFETLTSNKINSFKELATKSLLAKYNISYNYSMYLLEQNKNSIKFKNSFIAFAPEFNDKMKESYKLTITDSLNLDRTYLTLLQQPFNVNLAKVNAKLFDGDYFLNENSTENIFKKNASEHKIIHIGTHAESNNISPELSRLIFAKNVSDDNEDGSLYAYEIYNTSLNSNLAILTACETGKPTYQAGEGMISLAHAFNYAGSESILTSLWKVDERSTSEIVELFYNYINEGKPKDEALRLAKLDYINTIDGRTLAPQFWAGLVLMGDTSPIVIANNTNWIYWFIGVILLILLGLFFKNRIRRT